MKKYKLVNFCEFDPYATKSYCAIHNTDKELNLGDITKVDENNLELFNMIVGGSPCQDFSVAGKQKGAVWTCKDCSHEYNPLTVHWSKRKYCPECGSIHIEKTRSSLLVEWLRIIQANKPNFGIYENVKNIVGKEFKETTFKIFEQELNEYGYNTYWKVLNAKDYGIPQNRERVYLILIKKELDNSKFKFPEPFDNGVRLKDILETDVDESFYISEDKMDRFISNLNNKNSLLYDVCQVKREGKAREYNDYAPTLSARDYKDPRLVNDNVVKRLGKLNSSQDGIVVDVNGIAPTHTAGHGNCPKVMQLGNYQEENNFKNPQVGRVYSSDGLSPTLNTMQDGDRQPKILEPLIGAERGRYNSNGEVEQKLEINNTGNTNTITTVQKDNYVIEPPFRIRKLTPKECFRLMGFSDDDFKKAKSVGISNSQLYKQSGNSIVTDVPFYVEIRLKKR